MTGPRPAGRSVRPAPGVRWLVAAGVAVVVAGCGTPGSGVLVSEDRPVDSFAAVSISNGLELRLTVDPAATPEVVVNFDDNLIDRIETDVTGDELSISSSGSFNITGGGRYVSVMVPDVTSLTASGGSRIAGSGEAESLELGASGGADVDLGDLSVRTVTVDASGGADVTVWALDSIVGEASGGSNVTVIGDPAVVDVRTSGGADVDQR